MASLAKESEEDLEAAAAAAGPQQEEGLIDLTGPEEREMGARAQGGRQVDSRGRFPAFAPVPFPRLNLGERRGMCWQSRLGSAPY